MQIRHATSRVQQNLPDLLSIQLVVGGRVVDDVVDGAAAHELSDDVAVALVDEDAHEEDDVGVRELAHDLHLAEELGQALLAVVEELLDRNRRTSPVALPHLCTRAQAQARALLDLRDVDPRDSRVLLEQALNQLLVAHLVVLDLYRRPVARRQHAPVATVRRRGEVRLGRARAKLCLRLLQACEVQYRKVQEHREHHCHVHEAESHATVTKVPDGSAKRSEEMHGGKEAEPQLHSLSGLVGSLLDEGQRQEDTKDHHTVEEDEC
mmetsp:Transcript_748/g.2692  ORF Transcript_748/g.2692 Transcript_748/m.2692 type:complete len:265 (+) Transcript_748:495-1289(+)